ncbi:hypothetical protein PanWU01x14_118940, partial [Parasponia andersonii]
SLCVCVRKTNNKQVTVGFGCFILRKQNFVWFPRKPRKEKEVSSCGICEKIYIVYIYIYYIYIYVYVYIYLAAVVMIGIITGVVVAISVFLFTFMCNMNIFLFSKNGMV